MSSKNYAHHWDDMKNKENIAIAIATSFIVLCKPINLYPSQTNPFISSLSKNRLFLHYFLRICW